MPRPSGKATISLKGNVKNLPDIYFRELVSLYLRIPVKRRARSGGTVRSFQCKRRSRSIPNGVKRRPFVLSGQRPQFLTELRPLVS